MSTTLPLRPWSFLAIAFCSLVGLSASEVMADDAPQSRVSPDRIQAAIHKLEAIAEEALQRTGVPGIAIAVAHQNQVVFKRGFGVREAGKPDLVDADTVFQVASVSKPISSTVMALLVTEGTVNWDDRVIDHDPGFEMYHPFVTREVRLRDFLCHRSGLPDHAGDLLEDLGYERAVIRKRLRLQPPDSSFRSGYAYTNAGYSEACYAAALAAGESWPEVAAKKLFAPLGMNHSSYRFADYEKAENRALLHVREGDKWIAKYTRQPDAQAPAGGASTTLNDLTKWLQLQLDEGKFAGKQLVSAEALAETHQPQFVFGLDPATGRLSSYGLGWNVSVEHGGRVFYKHSGEFALGMRSEVALLPSERLAITVLSNAAPTGVPEALTESFFDLVLDGEPQRDWLEFAGRMVAEQEERDRSRETDYSQPPATPNPPLAISAYAGEYANDYFGPIEIVEQAGKLVLQAGPKPLEFDLRHWDRDVFVYQPTGEMAGGMSGLRFTIGPGERAQRVLIENLNVHGLGTFERMK